ncbi:MAG: Uracil-DNA glycosylase [Legionellaceae bacterium]
MLLLNKTHLHPSWSALVNKALSLVNQEYLNDLITTQDWLPGEKAIFSAFSYPLSETRYILFGESPYPRPESANGFAFWDAAVKDLWSPTGLSKSVNRATSLRHIIKMLLIAANALSIENTTQPAIATIDKTPYVKTIDELFTHFIQKGFLLLNASLVLSNKPVQREAKAWQPFINGLLEELFLINPQIQLILFGNIAKLILSLPAAKKFPHFTCEHPYNHSFIYNSAVINFFQPLNLLLK